MAVRTKGPTNQAGKKERAMTDTPPSDEGTPLSVEEAARRAQDAYDQLALNKLELLDKMSERARRAYRAGTNVNVDRAADAGNTKAMNDITREEFNARMETIEVKMDARVEAVSAKIDGFLAAQAERDKRLDESVANIRGDIARLGSLKLNIWGAMLTAVGIGIAVAALSVTFYQTGKADSPSANVQQTTPIAPTSASPKQ